MNLVFSNKLNLAFLIYFLCTNIFAFNCAHDEIEPPQKATVMTDSLGVKRLWSNVDALDLTYCISPNFKELRPLIVSALKIASADWMDAGNISFRYIPSADKDCDKKEGPTTRFRISINKSRRYPYAARAFFPYNERVTITFKKSFLEKGFQELLRLTRHELGHVLGLRHEHIRPENPLSDKCGEDSLFEPVTEYDRASIMHYARCGGLGSVELSSFDKEGISILYPF